MSLRAELAAILGEAGLLTAPADMTRYLEDPVALHAQK